MMKAATFVGLLASASMLSGCFSARQPNASGFTDEQQIYYDFFVGQGLSKENATLAAVSPVARQLYFDDRKCLSYGAKPGSDAYVACRAQLEAGHDKPQRGPVAPSADTVYYPGAAVPASDAPPLQNILPPTVRCQSVPAGLGTVQTVCR